MIFMVLKIENNRVHVMEQKKLKVLYYDENNL